MGKNLINASIRIFILSLSLTGLGAPATSYAIDESTRGDYAPSSSNAMPIVVTPLSGVIQTRQGLLNLDRLAAYFPHSRVFGGENAEILDFRPSYDPVFVLQSQSAANRRDSDGYVIVVRKANQELVKCDFNFKPKSKSVLIANCETHAGPTNQAEIVRYSTIGFTGYTDNK